ncbi:MAG: hypothetical protein LIQ30_08960, partial [Planctomycetes bacterium]|nr:hypothetical protein [Planctomycetota bacterium]
MPARPRRAGTVIVTPDGCAVVIIGTSFPINPAFSAPAPGRNRVFHRFYEANPIPDPDNPTPSKNNLLSDNTLQRTSSKHFRHRRLG